MSAGKPIKTLYSAAVTGQIHPITVQPETLTLTVDGQANTPPAGPATNSVPVRVSGSRRGRTYVSARLVRFKFTGAVPDGYDPNGTLTVPWLDEATFATVTKGKTGTYNVDGATDSPIEVVGSSNENRL